MGKGKGKISNFTILVSHAKKLAKTEKEGKTDPLKLWTAVMEKAIEEIEYKGINLKQRGWTVGFDRALRSFGCCHVSEKHITLSGPIIKETSDHYDEWVDTILHEMAHAFDIILHIRPKPHGASWKKICTDIGAAPIRCCHDEKLNQCSLNIREAKCKRPIKKWLQVCPNCNSVEKVSYRNYQVACGKCCNGSYHERFKFYYLPLDWDGDLAEESYRQKRKRYGKQLYLIYCPHCNEFRDLSSSPKPCRFDCKYCGDPLEAVKLTPSVLMDWAEEIYTVEGEGTLERCIESLEPSKELFDGLMAEIQGWEDKEDAARLVMELFQYHGHPNNKEYFQRYNE